MGHPLVFWEGSPTTRVEIVKGEPALMVRQTKPGWLAISLVPEVSDKKNIAVVKETPTRIKVVELNVNHHRIAEILGRGTTTWKCPKAPRIRFSRLSTPCLVW